MSGPWYYGAAYELHDDGVHRLHSIAQANDSGSSREARLAMWRHIQTDRTSPVMGKLLVIALPDPPKKLRLIDWRR